MIVATKHLREKILNVTDIVFILKMFVIIFKDSRSVWMIRRHIIFYGHVQGVGFRYYCVHKARQLGLTGWVKNKYDGTVEAEVQGLEEQIDQLIQYLNSQTYILITNMDVKKLPVIGEHDFIRKGY